MSSVKTAGTGPFQIPTAPAALTAVAQSASANTLGSAVSFGNAPSALYITGVFIGAATVQKPTYIQIQILAAASVIGSVLIPYGVTTGATGAVVNGYRAIWPYIPVANAAALTVKSASDVASAVAWGVSLECIAQTNVVDDAIAVSTVTNLTNAPTAGDLTAAMKASVTAAVPTAITIADLVWDEVLSTHLTAGSTGAALNSSGSAGDPWATALPGAYAAGTAGKIIGDKIVASVTGAVGSVTAGVTLANVAHGGAAATLTLGGAAGLTATHIGNQTGNVSGSVGSVTADVGITQAGADKVWSSAARTLTSFGTLVADMATAVWGATTRILTAGTNIVLAKGTGITGFNDIAATAIVSAGAITTSAGKVSGVILADTVTTYTGNTPQTGDAFARIGAAGAGLTAIGDTRMANLDAAISTRSTLAAGAAMTLTGLYDAAKTAATQASVNAIPTTPLLAINYTAPDNSGIAAIKAKTDSLTFTRPGEVDVNLQSVNDVPLIGTGAAGSEFHV